MSVLIQKGKAPEGAVRISREEAIKLQWKLVLDWKPASDVWPFRYGVASLAIGSAISGIMIASHFRRKLKLKDIGRIAMYLPNVVIPSLALPILHQKLVSEPILIQADCPVCIQLRSIVLQNAIGLVYPLILTPLSGYLLASTFATTRLPLLSYTNLGSLINVYRGIIEPFTTRLMALSIFHTVLAIAITESEAKSLFKIQKILYDKLDVDSEPLPISQNS
ncbi:hypothetical protein O3M35_009846 [Rhynocoris fuscipes]|uniref:Transmembrane protein 126A n=1 Tax=Rhynocoris fuscipes TaxID=488301 RepID=A0AAW1D796_9HEMI